MYSKVSVLEFACISADVYYPHNGNSPFRAYLRNRNWIQENHAVHPAPYFNHDFFARLYTRFPVKNILDAAVIAYRGTFLQDWGNDKDDFAMAIERKIPSSEAYARAFYTKINHYVLYKHRLYLKLTGHSLGGDLAELTAVKSSLHPTTVVFNAVGIGRLKGMDVSADYKYIHNFNSRDGEINKLGKTVGKVTYLDIKKDAKEAKRYGWLDIPAWAAQHRIANVVTAIKQDPKITHEMF